MTAVKGSPRNRLKPRKDVLDSMAPLMSASTEKASALSIAMLLLSIGGTTLVAMLQSTGTLDVVRFTAAVVVTLLGALLLLWREKAKDGRWSNGAASEAPEKPAAKKAAKKPVKPASVTDSEE